MAFVIAELIKRDISVSVPMTDNKRYDLIMDLNGQLFRMQVKTINFNEENGLMSFKMVSSNTTKTKGYYEKPYKENEIDGFLAYCIELNKVYLVWHVNGVKTRFFMRSKPARNNQRKNVRMAAEFELDQQLHLLNQNTLIIDK